MDQKRPKGNLEDFLREEIDRRNAAKSSSRPVPETAGAANRDEILMPDWFTFARSAEMASRTGKGLSKAWLPSPGPPGVHPGETIVGTGRKNLVLATKTTVTPPERCSEGERHCRRYSSPTLPCGIFVGLCRSLSNRWSEIEREILDQWNISVRDGDWADQRPFYSRLRDRHLGQYENRPGLIWAVPYWILTVNRRIEGELAGGIDLSVRRSDRNGDLAFGDASGLSIDLLIPRKVLGKFRFQTSSTGDEADSEIIAVNRTRYRKNGRTFMADNYFQGGTLDDEALKSRGYNRATEDYYQEIGGWRLHGAWAILMAAFVGTPARCQQVIYTHQVIDPFTQRSHDVGLIKMQYHDFWEMSYGLAETVVRLAH